MTKEANIYTRKPWVDHYDRHVHAHLDYPRTNLVDMFEIAAQQNPEKDFIHFKEDSFSYKQISQCVDSLSANLIMGGLEKGERVALMLPNVPQFIIANFAILKAGGIVTAMNPNYKQQEFDFLFRDSKPQKAICLQKHIQILEDLGFSNKDVIIVDRDQTGGAVISQKTDEKRTYQNFDGLCQESDKFLKNSYPEILPKDAAIFQYSGGTTGIPKAAIGSHENIVANVTQFKTWCNLEEGAETILGVIPLYHVYGMVLTMNLAIASRNELVLIDNPSDTEQILREIESRKVTFYPGVPTMFFAINQHSKMQSGEFDISSIKACISGSAPLHPEIKKEFERLTGGKLVEGYGLSEAPTATHCNPVYGTNKPGSIGLPLPDVECKVVDLETGVSEMPVGEPGELVIKGPQVMSGYHNQPDEEKIALRDGWLYTGDVVRMDEEGYFFIVDRKKSLIKVSGFQVWPNEVEQVITSNPEVKECAIGGVPDMKQNEKVIAWVVKRTNSSINEESIREWCRERLVNYKVPVEIYFCDKLPRSGVGKVLRRDLIREYQEKRIQ